MRQAFETLLGPGKGDLKTESARSRVKAARDRTLSPKRDSATCCISTEAAGEAIDRMLAQDIFGAQQLLAYIRPTKSTKVTKALQKLPRLFQIGFFPVEAGRAFLHHGRGGWHRQPAARRRAAGAGARVRRGPKGRGRVGFVAFRL